jgi:hypothetical protein
LVDRSKSRLTGRRDSSKQGWWQIHKGSWSMTLRIVGARGSLYQREAGAALADRFFAAV